MQRGEPEQSLQMFYSKVEIIAGLWFHLILLLLTGSFRRGIGFACSLAIDLRSAEHTALWKNKGESPACTACCLLVDRTCIMPTYCCCRCNSNPGV